MENAPSPMVALSVPLVVETGAAKNWEERISAKRCSPAQSKCVYPAKSLDDDVA